MPRIAEGVFFTSPPALPRGPHGLSRDQVLDAQRERLMIAFTELVAADGYHGVRVGDVVARSGMSRSAFYNSFATLDDCADAAYSRFIQVLVTQITGRLSHTDISNDLRAVIRAYLEALESDLVVARAFQLEFDAAGRKSRTRRREALTLIATVLHAEHRKLAETDPSLDSDLDPQAFLGAVYAVRQLASDWLDAPTTPSLTDLEPLVSPWLTQSLRRLPAPSAPPAP